jgi:Tfp pilus assembly protein PilE
MKKPLLIALLAAAILVGSGGPSFSGHAHAATRTQAHAQLFDKTRFLLHMGAAFYAFHHWIYAPYKQHAFDSGAPHRTKDLVKAGIAALFAAHEVHVAYGIAKGSNSKTLQLLVAPINKLGSTLTTAGADFKSGKFSSATMNSMTGSVNYIGSTAAKGGYGIKDIATHIPGL